MNVRAYDNGGKTIDRYTAVFLDFPDHRPGTYFALGMSDQPFHPLGVGCSTSAMPGRHLGRRVRIEDLPRDCQQLIAQVTP